MLKKHLILTGLCFLGCVIGNASAQDWRFSIGVNFRTYDSDDIQFKGMRFGNQFQTSTNGERYINGLFEESGTSAPDKFTVVDGPTQAPAFVAANGQPFPGGPFGGEVFLDRANFAGSSESADEGWGIVLGAHKTIEEGGDIQWNLDWWFSTSTASGDEKYSSVATRDTFDVEDGFATSSTEIFSSNTIGPSSAPGTLPQIVDVDYDLEEYKLSAGVSGTYFHDRLGLTLGAGPSITLGDFDVDRIARSTVDNAGTTITTRFSDSDDDYLFGIYSMIGAQVDISETVGVAIDYRYDWVFSDLTTNLAKIDVDGSSAHVRLVFMY